MHRKVDRMRDVKVLHGNIPMWYRYTVGVVAEKFLREIKDNGRFIGGKCRKCGTVYFPPKLYCDKCFEEINDFVPLPLRGEVISYTVMYIDLDENPLEKPEIVAFIGIPGAEGGIVHRLEGVTLDDIYIGMPVEPVFKEKSERKGTLEDIAYFKPV